MQLFFIVISKKKCFRRKGVEGSVGPTGRIGIIGKVKGER